MRRWVGIAPGTSTSGCYYRAAACCDTPRTEALMDWLEQWFGLNPDGGDGSIEAALVVVVVLVGVTIVGAASRRARARGLALFHRITRRSKPVR